MAPICHGLSMGLRLGEGYRARSGHICPQMFPNHPIEQSWSHNCIGIHLKFVASNCMIF